MAETGGSLVCGDLASGCGVERLGRFEMVGGGVDAGSIVG